MKKKKVMGKGVRKEETEGERRSKIKRGKGMRRRNGSQRKRFHCVKRLMTLVCWIHAGSNEPIGRRLLRSNCRIGLPVTVCNGRLFLIYAILPHPVICACGRIRSRASFAFFVTAFVYFLLAKLSN